MPFHHVIAKVGAEEKFRELFTDLSVEELSERFVKPYEKGNPFFSGSDLISPNDLRTVQIIRTERQNEIERVWPIDDFFHAQWNLNNRSSVVIQRSVSLTILR